MWRGNTLWGFYCADYLPFSPRHDDEEVRQEYFEIETTITTGDSLKPWPVLEAECWMKRCQVDTAVVSHECQ